MEMENRNSGYKEDVPKYYSIPEHVCIAFLSSDSDINERISISKDPDAAVFAYHFPAHSFNLSQTEPFLLRKA